MIVAVTGASGYLGSRLVHHLEGVDEVEGVLAVDTAAPREPAGPKTHLHLHDVSLPLGDLFVRHEVDAAVHLAFQLHPGRDTRRARSVNVGGARHVLDACDAAGVKRLVHLSSTTVYGAHADNPAALTEESPARPIPGHGYAEHKAEAEALFLRSAAQGAGVTVTVLRGCPVLGPNADNFIARSLSRSLPVAVAGYNPPMQLVHEDDMTAVIARCVLADAPGTYNVAGEGTIGWRELASALGRWTLTLPAAVLYPATEAAWRLRLQSRSPSSGLDLIRYPWTVSTEKARRELGVSFRYSTLETVESFVGRR